MAELHQLSVPTVTAINGVAAGGGVGLALCADVCIAARSAYFVLTFGQRLGIAPDLGSTWQLARRLPRGKAMPVALLGGRLSSAKAERLGMIWDVVDDADVVPQAVAIARQLASASQPAMIETRRLLDQGAAGSFLESLEAERQAQRRLFDDPANPRHQPGGAAHSRRFREDAKRRQAKL